MFSWYDTVYDSSGTPLIPVLMQLNDVVLPMVRSMSASS